MVAELLADESIEHQLDLLTPQNECEFEKHLVDRELAMMADGVAPERSYFRLAVIRAARDSLLLQAEIRRLPSTTTVKGRPQRRAVARHSAQRGREVGPRAPIRRRRRSYVNLRRTPHPHPRRPRWRTRPSRR